MSTYLAAVTHNIKTNTLEATWRDENDVPARCHSYSASQADMFLADTGPEGQRYLDAAGWTPEFCAAFTAEQERLAAEVQAKAAAAEIERITAEQVAFNAEVKRQVEILRAAQSLVASES